MHRAIRIARVRGVEVRLDASLLLLALLLVWLLTTRFQATWTTGAAVTMAVTTSLLFFVSILVHELAHALEALHRDIEVDRITLLLFGGVTEMHSESQHPRDEFVVAAVGPYASLVCAAVFGLLAVGAAHLATGATAAALLEVGRLLATLNLLLAVFNLVPGAPLDGGRVLRAALWWFTGDRIRAVRGAARAGQAFGALLVVFGIVEFTRGLEVAAIGGLWWILIGVFLAGAARGELRRADMQALYRGRTVVDVMGPEPPRVASDERLDLVDPEASDSDHLLITAPGGPDEDPVVGWLDPADVQAMHPADRSVRTAGDLARPVRGLPAVTATTSLETLVHRFLRTEEDRLRVEHEGRIVAILSERRTARALRELGAGRRRGWRRSVPATTSTSTTSASR
jgi:Zn-dependent protease